MNPNGWWFHSIARSLCEVWIIFNSLCRLWFWTTGCSCSNMSERCLLEERGKQRSGPLWLSSTTSICLLRCAALTRALRQNVLCLFGIAWREETGQLHKCFKKPHTKKRLGWGTGMEIAGSAGRASCLCGKGREACKAWQEHMTSTYCSLMVWKQVVN